MNIILQKKIQVHFYFKIGWNFYENFINIFQKKWKKIQKIVQKFKENCNKIVKKNWDKILRDSKILQDIAFKKKSKNFKN